MTHNLDKPVLEVLHAALKRWGGSFFKSKCPACGDGLLMVRRDNVTLVLQEFDNCVACGQQVRYLDIKEMRDRERLPRTITTEGSTIIETFEDGTKHYKHKQRQNSKHPEPDWDSPDCWCGCGDEKPVDKEQCWICESLKPDQGGTDDP